MHVAKFKGAGAVQVVKHIERDRPNTAKYGNERIDSSRTHQNYSIELKTKDGRAVAFRQYSEAHDEAKAKHEATTGKQARSDAVSLVCAVIQLPREYCDIRDDGIATAKNAEEARDFFRCATIATLRHFNIRPHYLISAEVHLDETTPHVHVAWVPFVKDKLNAKEQVNRSSLRSYHDYVDKFLRDSLSWYRGGLVSDEPSARLRASDNLTMQEVRKAKRAVVRASKAYKFVNDLPSSERELYDSFLKNNGLLDEFEQYKSKRLAAVNVLTKASIKRSDKGGREM